MSSFNFRHWKNYVYDGKKANQDSVSGLPANKSAKTPDEELSNQRDHINKITRAGFWECVAAMFITIFILNSYIDVGYTLHDRALISSLAVFSIFALFQGEVYVVWTTTVGDAISYIFHLKTPTLSHVTLLAVGCAIRVLLILSGSLFGVMILQHKYSKDQLKIAADSFLFKSSSNWSTGTVFCWVAFSHALFNYAVFQCCHRTNVPSFTHRISRDVKSTYIDEIVTSTRVLFPFIIAAVYYLCIVAFSKDIGDPIQTGIYIALQWVVGYHHATAEVIAGAIVGAVTPIVFFLIEMWWVKKSNSSPTSTKST